MQDMKVTVTVSGAGDYEVVIDEMISDAPNVDEFVDRLIDGNDNIGEMMLELVNTHGISVQISPSGEMAVRDEVVSTMIDKANQWLDDNTDGTLDAIVDIIQEETDKEVRRQLREWATKWRKEHGIQEVKVEQSEPQ